MNRYSDMTVWRLRQEREAIETELARRYVAPRLKSEPNAAASSPGIPSDGTIHEGTAPQGATALNEMDGSTLTHAVAAGPAPAAPDVARIVELLREGATVLDEPYHHRAIANAMLDAAALLTKLGQGWVPVSGDLKLAKEVMERDDRDNQGSRILRPGITDEYKLARALIGYARALQEAAAIGIANMAAYCGAYESLNKYKQGTWRRLNELHAMCDALPPTPGASDD